MTEAAPGGASGAAAPALNLEPESGALLSWQSRWRRLVTVYLPLVCFLIILLFPFYWMAITAFKPDAELLDYKQNNPFLIQHATLANIRKLLFDTDYPRWLATTMMVAFASTFLSLFASVLAAYAIQRLRFRGSTYVGLAIYLAYLVPPSILFIPLATMVFQLGLFDTPLALILTIRPSSFRSAPGCSSATSSRSHTSSRNARSSTGRRGCKSFGASPCRSPCRG
jgi:ABC-type maltose transport system permease subunit